MKISSCGQPICNSVFGVPSAIDLRPQRRSTYVYPAKTHLLVVLLVSELLLSGHLTAAAQSNPTPRDPAASNPQLDHFDVTQIDRNLDPCIDFCEYTCQNWICRN